MILVDTSVWVDHFRQGNGRLEELLNGNEVYCHPFVLGELACGNFRKRDVVLGLLSVLPEAHVADHDEILHFVDVQKLYGTGMGWIDVHLLGSALLTKCSFWSLDKALSAAAKKLGISG